MKALGLIAAALIGLSAHATSIQTHKFQPGSFNLNQPGMVPNPNCYTFVNMTLDKGQLFGPFAVLENRVGGLCEIYAAPNTRFYDLKLAGIECGSGHYEATRITEDGPEKLTLIDHRTRTCRDVVPAKLIVMIESPDGQVTTLHGMAPVRR